MAYTKIHAIKATVNRAIDYICNPAKTDEKILIDSFGTAPETAHFDFKSSLSKTSSSDPNLAFHLIQSFLPGEVTYDEAHSIGIELADRLLEGKYSYVIATHIDHDHVHNHIIFCAADNIDHHKYHDCKSSYYHIRNLSDQLCAEHNLSIIKPGPQKGMHYKEWAENKKGNSLKKQLRNDINECISLAKNYENFIELIKVKGYEVKGESLEENAPKYIAFRPIDYKHFIRGSARSLGSEYTKESICNKINDNALKRLSKIPFPKKKPQEDKQLTQEQLVSKKPKNLLKGSNSTLIDTSSDKMQQSPGLLKWANVQNLKAAAHAYAIAGDIASLESKISELEATIKVQKNTLVALEKKMKTASEILHYADIYKTNLRYHNAMQRSKDPDRYYREHDEQINLFNATEHALQHKYKINPSIMDYPHMLSSFQLMQEKKDALYSSLKQEGDRLKVMTEELKCLRDYTEIDTPTKIQENVIQNNQQRHIQK